MKVLVVDRFDLQALTFLKTQPGFEVVKIDGPQPTPEQLSDVEALVIRSRTKITKSLLAMAPKLKFVVTATSGFDHIDLDATREKKLTVAYTPEANAQSAAELTWALVLSSTRRLTTADSNLRNGNWSREHLVGFELYKKTYGVIGLGRIGTRVARIAHAFGMKVLAYDPYVDDEIYGRAGAIRVGLDELVRLSDVISLHVPKTAETTPLIRPWHFEVMQAHAVLVNTSRGTAIDESALSDALLKNRIWGAGLDVFEREPLALDSPLVSLKNTSLTPHIGATTEEAFAKASFQAAEKVAAFFAGKSVEDRLPPQAEWFSHRFGP